MVKSPPHFLPNSSMIPLSRVCESRSLDVRAGDKVDQSLLRVFTTKAAYDSGTVLRHYLLSTFSDIALLLQSVAYFKW